MCNFVLVILFSGHHLGERIPFYLQDNLVFFIVVVDTVLVVVDTLTATYH